MANYIANFFILLIATFFTVGIIILVANTIVTILWRKVMIMKVVYPDGSWFIGKRGQKEMGYIWNHETHGTHHFTVIDTGLGISGIKIGQEIAVSINAVKYFVLNYKEV